MQQADALIPRLLAALLARLTTEEDGLSHATPAAALLAVAIQLAALRWRRGSLAEAFYGLQRLPQRAGMLRDVLQAVVLAAGPLLLDAVRRAAAQRAEAQAQAEEAQAQHEMEMEMEAEAMAVTEVERVAAVASGSRAAGGEGDNTDHADTAVSSSLSPAWPSRDSDLWLAAQVLVGALLTADTLHMVAYAVGAAEQPSLAMRAAGVVLLRPGASALYEARYAAERQARRAASLRTRVGPLRRVLLSLAEVGGRLGAAAAPLAALSVTLAISAAERPPAPTTRRLPPPPPRLPTGHVVPQDAPVGACPHCKSTPPSDPVVLPCAGVVACRECWVQLLDTAGGCCPFSGIAATPNDLRRVRLEATV